MLMSKKYACCHKCFAYIAKQSTIAAKLWLDLCILETRSLQKHSFHSQIENDAVRILEINGYIVTHEDDQEIIIKVLCQQEDEQGIYFCNPENCYD